MCLGLPIALCLSPAEKGQSFCFTPVQRLILVWRKDGTRVPTARADSWGAEFKAVFQLFASRRILLLLPAFFISYFYNGFVSTWLTKYFVS